MIPSPRVKDPESRFFIVVHEMGYVYPGGQRALNRIDLHLRAGEYLAIVGGNGSGKTTLAKTLNGLLRPTSGSITVAGKDASSMSVAELARHVGYAFQNPDHQLFSSTVEEEVRFGPRNLGFPEKDVSSMVEHAIQLMGIEEVRTQPPLSLALGLRRKVSIASVIAMDPQVIILDEPTTGLDADEIEDLMRNAERLNAEGHTIILITHDMRLVAEHAKRVLVMTKGRVSLDSDPRGVFSDLEVLRETNLVPPPVTLLAHRLARYGLRKDIFSPQEFAAQILALNGGTR